MDITQARTRGRPSEYSDRIHERVEGLIRETLPNGRPKFTYVEIGRLLDVNVSTVKYWAKKMRTVSPTANGPEGSATLDCSTDGGE